MRKFFINGRFLTQSITGVQRYAHELTRAFDSLLDERADFAAEIVCPPLEGAPPSYRNIPVRIVGSRGGHFWEQTTLPAIVGDGTVFCPGNTAPLRSLFGKARVIVCVHDLSYLYFPDAYSTAYRAAYNVLTPLIFRRADAVITVSNSERAAIVGRYPHVDARISAIQNGGLNALVPLDRDRAQDMPDPGYILYVGSLSKRKNFPMTFRVACELAAKRGLRTVFVGGTAASLEATDQRVPDAVADRIIFAGQVNDTARLVDYYKGAALFLFPSLYEASPLPPIEAMGCGVPVVASSIASLEERCGDAALYCDPHDSEDIMAKVELVLDQPDVAAGLIARGLRRAEDYSWRNCALRTLERIGI